MRYLFRGEDLEGEAELTDEALELRSKSPLTIRYTDIDSARAEDYRIHMTIYPGQKLELYHLAKKYEGFVEEFFEKRNSALARELFLADRRRIATFKGRFARSGSPPLDGRIDLFPRTIVFFPKTSDPSFLRIAELEGIRANKENYIVEVRAGETVTVSYLGLRFEEFQERLKRTRQSMEKRCAQMLEALVPGAGPMADRMLDGNVIPLADIAPLEERVCGTEERLATFRHLKSIATGPIWIGVKEIGGDDLDELHDEAEPGLRHAEAVVATAAQAGTQHLIWYYAPVRNLCVHEVVSEEDHATYVYRADARAINRAWAMVQFRRDVLISPEKYPAAYRKLQHLRAVAGALVGRAIHNESWASQLARLTSLP